MFTIAPEHAFEISGGEEGLRGAKSNTKENHRDEI